MKQENKKNIDKLILIKKSLQRKSAYIEKKIKIAKLQLIIEKKEIELRIKNHRLRISKRKILVYMIFVIALFSLIWSFSSLKVKSVDKKIGSTFMILN